jgi:hypothetical protein
LSEQHQILNRKWDTEPVCIVLRLPGMSVPPDYSRGAA